MSDEFQKEEGPIHMGVASDITVIKDTEVALKKEINMEVKGWSMSGEKPP